MSQDPVTSPPVPSSEDLRSPAGRLLEHSAAAMALTDLEGRLTYVNPAFLALWRLDSAICIMGHDAAEELWIDADAARAVMRSLRSESVWQGELGARRGDGTTFPARVTAQLLRGSDGRPVAILGNIVDISVERSAQRAWQAEREFTELVLGGAGVLLAAVDEDARFVRFNAECERVSGWRADEILGRRPWDTVLPPEVADKVRQEAFQAAIDPRRVGQTTTYTGQWLARDGTRRLIDWTDRVVIDPDSGRRFLITVGVDVTARHEAELALRRSAVQLRQAQAVAQLGWWELDILTNRLVWSDEVYRLFERDATHFGSSYEAFLGVVHPDDREAVSTAYERSLQTREPYRIEHRVLTPDGRVKWVEERCETDFDADGHAMRSRGTVQDVTERRLREIELQRFRHLVEQAPEEVWLTDEKCRVVYANAAACESLGYAPRQLIGKPLSEIDAGGEPSIRRVAQSIEQHRFAESAPAAFRIDHVHADGRVIPKEMHATVREIDGRPHGISFARDITDRLRAEQALADSEAKLREALDTYPGWVACVDEEMRYVFVNARFCETVARDETDIIGRTADEVIGPEGSAERWATLRQLLSGDRQQVSERRFVDRQGRERIAWVQYRSVDRPAGGRLFYAYATDVTELRRAQLRLSTVTQGIGAGLWECTYPGLDLECNDELLSIVGYTRHDVVGPLARWLTALVDPADRVLRAQHLRAFADSPATQASSQFRLRHKAGHAVWLQEQVRVLSRDGHGKPLRMIGVLQDISALKAQKDELQRLNAELEGRIAQRTLALARAKEEAERANQAKSEFLSQMSHELRTPLNAIIGFSQLLEMSRLDAEDAEHVQQVMRAGRHLLELIEDVLDLATVEAGRVELRTDPVDLRALVLDCARLLAATAAEAGVTIDHHAVVDDAAVCADRGRLRQVLLNLLTNAIKYGSRPQGQVRVAVQRSVVAVDCWELLVSDSGPGLDESQVARLFQPFERLDAGRTTVKGTGIGLSISRRLIELMGGCIGVTSSPGQGATFWVRLPAASRPPAVDARLERLDHQAAGASLPSARGRLHVLYVEDNEANRLLMQRLLERRADVELRVVASAEAALSLVGAWRPDLLLLDIQLPGIDGHELLTLLRQTDDRALAVAVTAGAMPGDLERGRAAGFDAYLTKPLDLDRILRLLEDARLHAGRPHPT